jgi:phosphoserine phosphatase
MGMNGSEGDPVVIRLRREIHSTLQTGLRSAGLAEVHQVLDEMKRRTKERHSFVPERTLRRYLHERDGSGIPKDPKDATRESLRLLAQMGHVEEPVMRLCDELWTYCHRERSQAEGLAEGIPSTWFGVISRQHARPYTSIDRWTVTKQEHEMLSGTIVRLSPPSERGLRWHFSGTRQGFEGLFLVFRPLNAENATSRGTIALRQVEYRPLRYRGTYTRLDLDPSGHRRLVTRELTLRPDVPPEAFRRVALLDLDNTLRKDWTIRRWLKFLSRNGMSSASEALSKIENLMAAFAKGQIDHDELARQCADVYAEGMRDGSVEDIDDWAAVFVQGPDADALHDFAKPLVEDLIERGIAPVIVSGAPRKVVKRHARRLGISEAFGLTLGTVAQGEATDSAGPRYDGTVTDNPGLAARKGALVRSLIEEGGEIVLAVGDSESDEPLWEAAPHRVIVGDRVPPDPWDVDRTLVIHPGTTPWPDVAEWLDAHLDIEDLLDSV